MSRKDKKPYDSSRFEEAVEKYFQGKMNPAEEAGFLSFLNENPELRENFELEKDLRHLADRKNNPEKYRENQDILHFVRQMIRDGV